MTKFLNDTGLGTLISLIKGEINDKKSIYIGTSPSGDASKKDKTATTDTFPTVTENNVTKPKTGTIVGIKFLASNTYKTANSTYTLNVNSTGAYPMYYNNAELATSTSANTLVAGYKNRYCYYVFNGSQWVWLTASYDTNTTYSAMTQAEVTAGTGTTARIVTPKLLRDNFYTEGEVNEKLPLVVNFTESNNVVTCDTSIADIYAAYSARREVFGRYNAQGQLNLTLCLPSVVTFSNAFGNSIAQVMGVVENNTDTWTNDPISLQTQLTFDSTPTLGSSRPVTSEGIKVALNAKQDTLTFDNTPTANSTNPVTSGGIKTAIDRVDNVFTVHIYSDDMVADETLGQIYDAHQAGKAVFLVLNDSPANYDDYYVMPLSYVSLADGAFFSSTYNYDMVCIHSHPEDLEEHGRNSTNYQISYYPLLGGVDNTPTDNSQKVVKSGGVYTALQGKQNTLVSGTNIKTVNSNSLLGSGNLQLDVIAFIRYDNGTYTAELSFSEIAAAHNTGKTVALNYDSKIYHLAKIDNSSAKFTHSDMEDGTNGTFEIDSNGVKYYTQDYQTRLISGTNIKTVNSQTLLGSGDILLNAATIGTSPSGNYDGDPIEEVLDEKQDTLVSGTNIKTVNNNSLLGSGNISIEPNEITSITTTESTASGGNNTVTITETSGTTHTFNVKNGIDGADGVSLGEISLVQTTGTATDVVMSQKAVSEQVERLTSNDLGSLEDLTRERRFPYGYDELDWIYNGAAGSGGVIDTGLIPDDANWVFEGSFYIVGNASESYAGIISAYSAEAANTYRIIRNGSSNVALYVNAHSKASGGASSVNIQQQKWYDFGLKQGSLILNGTNNTINTTTGTTLTSTMKLGGTSYPVRYGEFKAYHNGVLVADLVPCKHGEDVGMYDIVRGQFFVSTNAYNFIAGDFASAGKNRLVTGEGLASLIAQEAGDSEVKLMSQKATKSLYYNPASMFKGLLVSYVFDDFQDLDLRECDELSFVFDRRYPSVGWLPGGNSTITNVTPFEIYKDANNYLRIKQNGMYLNVNLRINNADVVNKNLTDSTQLSPNEAEHIILCLDFKNAIADIYMNGIVRYTNLSVANEDLTPYIRTLTNAKIERGESWGSMGGAIVNAFLSSDEVKEIYNAGSYVDWFVPNTFVSAKFTPFEINLSMLKVVVGTASDKTANSITATCTGSNSNNYLQTSDNSTILSSYIETKRVEIKAHISMNSGSITVKGFGLNGRFIPTVLDSNGDEVSKTLVEGSEYDLYVRGVAPIGTSGTYALNFTHTNGCTFTFSHLTIKQIGAVVLASPQNYYGTYFKQESGDKLPTSCTPFYEPYKLKIVPYGKKPQFTGQMAIDATNSKVYIGVNTTWKQINNS